MPKSSRATRTPSAFIFCNVASASSGSEIITLSVISIHSKLASTPDRASASLTTEGRLGSANWRGDTFTETRIRTKSGEELEADVILTATGFNLSVLGDIEFTLDGTRLNLADTVTYRGMMFTGVPNLLWVFGYFRASWTLRADLIGDLTCRLLRHMDELGAKRVTPQLRPEDADMPITQWMDPDNFNPNYLMRSQHLLPKAGNKPEWQHTQDYWYEKDALPAVDLDDGCLVYE